MCSGDHVIEEKLKALEHYRLDKPKTEEEEKMASQPTQSNTKQKESARKQESKQASV